jgi:hypothetical protein
MGYRCKEELCPAGANSDAVTYQGFCVSCYHRTYPDARTSGYKYENRTQDLLQTMLKNQQITGFHPQWRISQVATVDASKNRSGKKVYMWLECDFIVYFKRHDDTVVMALIEVDGGQHTRIKVAWEFCNTDYQRRAAEKHRGGPLGVQFDRDISKENHLRLMGAHTLRISNVNRPSVDKWNAAISRFIEQCKSTDEQIFVVHPIAEYQKCHDSLALMNIDIPSWRTTMQPLKGAPSWRTTMQPLEDVQQPQQRTSKRRRTASTGQPEGDCRCAHSTFKSTCGFEYIHPFDDMPQRCQKVDGNELVNMTACRSCRTPRLPTLASDKKSDGSGDANRE